LRTELTFRHVWSKQTRCGRHGGRERSFNPRLSRVRVAASPPRSDSAARILSVIGLPPVLAFPTAYLAGVQAGSSPETARSVVGLLLTGCILPTLLTVALVRFGRVSTLDLREHGDRLLPSLATAGGCAFAWSAMSLSGAPQSVSELALGI